jgi:hypothetical protein
METEEYVSNWARACQALGLDWPAEVPMNGRAAAIERPGRLDDGESAASHDTSVSPARQLAQASADQM